MIARCLLILGAAALAGACASRPPAVPTFAEAYKSWQSGQTDPPTQQLRIVAGARHGTMDGALAIDLLSDIRGRALPERSYECSVSAMASYAAGQDAYEAHDYVNAEPLFRQALDDCPGNATWWIHWGDVAFGQGEYSTARQRYLRGLEIDPWNRAGRRFLADAEMKLGAGAESYRQLVLAVVADPTYEAGWNFLEKVTVAAGGRFLRRYEPKQVLTFEDGGIQIDLCDPAAPFVPAWDEYHILRFGAAARLQKHLPELKDELQARLPTVEQWLAWRPIERERFLVSVALDEPDVADEDGRVSAFWPRLRRAVQAGFADEAIYFGLLDRELAPDYVAHRRDHADRLIAYVTGHLAVLPQPN